MTSNRIKQECKDMSFDDQCTNCEKKLRLSHWGEKEAVKGAHYDFVKGTFDLWELDFKTTYAFALS
ncbi:hypothetical protein Bca52824_032346 [Brassica carinata]|uniref:Carbonic anhydrase n=1 Tax=Brassica carinata TaxID=52824 RepID=A0A8X7SBW1_BRACI|nr:hypothetical protein Bca52824_032346 [Brassica carinata]